MFLSEQTVFRPTYVFFRIVFIMVMLLWLSGCQTTDRKTSDQTSPNPNISFLEQKGLEERIAQLDQRENALNEREAAVSSREQEVVTVLAELFKQKEQLELQQQISDQAAVSNAPQQLVAPQTKKAPPRNPQNQAKNSSSNTQKTNDPKDKRKVLGGLEHVLLDPPGITLSARIDTGAQTSSLNALDMVEFERDGKPYIKFNILNPDNGEKIELVRRVRGHTKIKKHKIESQRRPIVRLRVKLGDLDEHISFTLIDRSKFKQQVLIGRNFLRDLAIVDVSKEYTVSRTNTSTQQ